MKNIFKLSVICALFTLLSCKKDKVTPVNPVSGHALIYSGAGSGYKTIISLQRKGSDSLTVLSAVDNAGNDNIFKTTINNGDHLKIEFIPDHPDEAYFFKLSDNNVQVDAEYINLAEGSTITISYPKD